MLEPKKLREEIIRPTLQRLTFNLGLEFGGQNVEDLLVMIAAHESHLGKLRTQVGGGPARGIYQIEIPTHDDLFDNYLEYRPNYKKALLEFYTPSPFGKHHALTEDDFYSTAVARFLLWRKPEAIPSPHDFAYTSDPSGAYLWNLALYAKTHWNTEGGAATPEKYLNDYLRLT